MTDGIGIQSMKVIISDVHKVIKKLETLLKKKKPKTFNPEWIKYHSAALYKELCRNHQTETKNVDWDFITINLDPAFQKRWKRKDKKIIAPPYENKEELSLIFCGYDDKLYTLMAPLDQEDRQIQDQIMIKLVRCAQNGNESAKEHIMECMTFVIYEWIENSRYLIRWKGNTSEIGNRIERCIRNYRYSGSFMKYIFRTFQYSARGLRPIFSLDDKFRNSTKRRIDYLVQMDD